MNTSILVSSFKYLYKFELVVSLSIWVNDELYTVKCTYNKLSTLLRSGGLEAARPIIRHCKDKSILNKLLSSCLCSFDYVKLLVESGADNYSSVLIAASLYGYIQVVEYIIDFSISEEDIIIALSCASDQGYLDIVKTLSIQVDRIYDC